MLKSDRSIRMTAREHDVINPFSEEQVREGVISYGFSCGIIVNVTPFELCGPQGKVSVSAGNFVAEVVNR